MLAARRLIRTGLLNLVVNRMLETKNNKKVVEYMFLFNFRVKSWRIPSYHLKKMNTEVQIP